MKIVVQAAQANQARPGTISVFHP